MQTTTTRKLEIPSCSAEQTTTGKGSTTPTPFNLIARLHSVSRLMTVAEVAEILGKEPCTIYRIAQKKQIPSLMIGGSRSFDPSTLIIWASKKEPQLMVAARQLNLIAA